MARIGAFIIVRALAACAVASVMIGGCASMPILEPTSNWVEPAKDVTKEQVAPKEPAADPDDKSELPADLFPKNEPDVKPTFELRGRIHADAIWVDQSEPNKAIFGNVANATGFRRARLGAQGTVGEHVNWVSEFDFAGGEISFKDVYLGVSKLPYVERVRVGHMREPFGLENFTSSNVFTFVERSPVNVLAPPRNWGVGLFSYTEDERATFGAGAYRSGTSNLTGNDFSDANDMAYTFRAAALPWYDVDSEGRYLMHLGAAFSQRFPANDLVTISQKPQNSLLTSSDNPGSTFIPTIKVPANQLQVYNLEWALVLGALSFQAEWTAMNIDQIGGGPVYLHGSYVFASYFLTGEHRQYTRADGTFGVTRVLSPFLCMKDTSASVRGPGAWELTARFAYVNFASGNIPRSDTGLQVGNRDAELTLGLNWYLNDYTRIMFNYVHAVPVDPNFGPSAANAFFLRTAIFW